MNEVIIRKADMLDIERIQYLYRQLDSHHVELRPDIFQPVDGYARPNDLISQFIQENDSDYLVAEIDGRVIGFLSIKKTSNPGFPMFKSYQFALIDNAIVDKSYRGLRIGRRLIESAIQWARDKNLQHVQIQVWSINKSTKEFYLRQGFQPMTEKLELDI